MIFEQTAGNLLDRAIIIEALSDSLAQAKFINEIQRNCCDEVYRHAVVLLKRYNRSSSFEEKLNIVHEIEKL